MNRRLNSGGPAKGPSRLSSPSRISELSLRRWHIDRTGSSSIDGRAEGHPDARRRIQRHRQGTLASLKYLQRCPHAQHAADYLVRDRAACRCLARPSGFTRLHSLGQRLCDLTSALNQARHTGNHCAPRCPTGPDSEPAPFCKTENRVQFTRAFGRRLRRKDALTLAISPTPLVPNTQSQGATNLLPATGVGQQKKAVPISVFVSRKLSKLFVRQGFTSLFDVPIKIKNPDEPLGTHVFTLLEPQSKGALFRWNVVSMRAKVSGTSASLNKKPKAPVQATSGTVRSDRLPDSASAALDRVEIPRDEVGRISQFLTPGSSLILSDYELSTETGDDTDFIVVMP